MGLLLASTHVEGGEEEGDKRKKSLVTGNKREKGVTVSGEEQI